MEMNNDIHDRGLERSHNQRKEYAIAVGRRNMSQREFDRELVELKVRLNIIREFLQESNED
jgi:hypothetical protein